MEVFLPSTREIRRRIKSIRNTAKITKAMELVAASKMRRAQEAVLASRPYAEKMREVLTDLSSQLQGGSEALHPLLEAHPEGKACIVLMTADRGLCGGFNANVLRFASSLMLEQAGPVSLVAVGRKGRDFMYRHGQDVAAEFTNLGDYPRISDTAPIARLVIDDYTAGRVSQTFLVYTRFYNTMTQRPLAQRLLPIKALHREAVAGEKPRKINEYIYEPTPRGVLDHLLPRFVEIQVYQALLESIASEHSARMVAMRNATDNAYDIIDELTLYYNKARQAAITREIIDITTSARAVKR
jgi:F-type H+-transporting ATPase subunit gamma